MKRRGVAAVVILTIVTFGIYGLVWLVKTKNEMNSLGANIPTAWLLIVPLVNIYWIWKYSEGVEKVTNSKLPTVLGFILLYLLSIVGMAIVQSEFNKVAENPSATGGGSMPTVGVPVNGPAVTPPVASASTPEVVTPTVNPTPQNSFNPTAPQTPATPLSPAPAETNGLFNPTPPTRPVI